MIGVAGSDGRGLSVELEGESRISRKRRKTLQLSRAACRRVSPMPAGSECQTSGLRSWESRGNRIVVNIVVISVAGLEGAGAVMTLVSATNVGSSGVWLFRAVERRTRWRELSACVRIWRQGFREWVLRVRKGGDQ